MGIRGLPNNFSDWQVMRESHLKENLQYTGFTDDLYKQYKKHLGLFRYQILKQAQTLIVPERINNLLSLGKIHWLAPVLKLYKFLSIVNLQGTIKYVFLPSVYKRQIKELDLII